MATRARNPAPPGQISGRGGGPVIVWRTWLIAPDPRRPEVPILTGILGFPWEGPEIDAKCTIQDRNPEGSVFVQARIDRHHPRIPDPHCTCGLYAHRQDLHAPPLRLVPAGVPLATGFAELSGAMVGDGEHIRAAHARIVGPLMVLAGKIPARHRMLGRLGRPRRPGRVERRQKTYRVSWIGSARHGRFEEWRADVARQLRHRYSVDVT